MISNTMTMKNTFKTFLIIISIMIFSSCDKVLDVEIPSSITSNNYWSTEDDARAYLTGIYDQFRDVNNTTLYGEDRGDHFVGGLEIGVTTAWSQTISSVDAPSWLEFYNLIHNCNLLLEQIEGLNFADENEKNRVKAEAHFIRAHTYFTLAKTWGDVPLVLKPTRSPDEELKGRAPVSEVFSQILLDIETAIQLFPNDGFINKNMVSKPATFALLAEVKMWTGKVLGGGDTDFQSALTAISEIEQSGVMLLDDYASIFSSQNKKNDEIILSIYFDRDEQSGMYGSRSKPRDIFVQDAENVDDIPFAQGGARNNYAPSPSLRSLYSENEGDIRESAAIIDAIKALQSSNGGDSLNNGSIVYDTIGTFTNKFVGTVYPDDRNFDDDLILYRWGGMLLLRAEAHAALGNLGQAVDALNLVRNRAEIGEYDGAMEKNAIELEIFKEEGRELFYELKHWWDLVRFYEGGTIDIYQSIPNLVGKTTPIYFPVAQPVIDLNDKIEQTPGY